MKTQEIMVNRAGAGIEQALEMTEKTGQAAGLAHKENLRLRLLAEELFGMMNGISGKIGGVYYIEHEGKSFELHLKAEVILTAEMKEQFLGVSSTGKNAAAKGFMGKLRDMIATVLLSMDESISMSPVGFMDMGTAAGYCIGMEHYEWYMQRYKAAVLGKPEDEQTQEAWDELEKSIAANIADDIGISIISSNVEIIIKKAF